MNSSNQIRNSVLGAVGLAGLVLYVLACSSFSPDDSEVACPAFDPQTGDLGVSVVHRKSGQVEPVFSLGRVDNLENPRYGAALLRTGWLDNKHLAVVWPEEEHRSDSQLNVATVPVDAKDTLRLFSIAEVHDAQEKLNYPLALAGSRLLMVVESNLVLRLDLRTGLAESRHCRGAELGLFPSDQSEFVIYSSSGRGPDEAVEFGTMNAATFEQTPLLRFDGARLPDKTPFALSRDGKQFATVEEEEGALQVTLRRAGRPVTTNVAPCQAVIERLGNACFAPNGGRLYVAFLGSTQTDTNPALGFLEVPLDGKPAEATFILKKVRNSDESIRYFEIALSHDGKTLAVCTTYLCGGTEDDSSRPAECGLYLVDVSRKPHGITKASLPTMKPGKKFK